MLLLGRVLPNSRLPGGRRLLFEVVVMCSETLSLTGSERYNPTTLLIPGRPLDGCWADMCVFMQMASPPN